MSAWVDVANRALGLVGNERLMALDEASNAAGAVRAHMDAVSDAVLRSHPWNCAIRRALLAADATPPVFGFVAAFTLPANPYCLRVLGIGSATAPYKGAWQIEGRKLLADAGGPLPVRYIARVDPVDWDAMLADVIAVRLAAAIAYQLTSSRDAEAQLLKQFEALLRDARSIDGQEGSVLAGWQSDLITARY